MKKEEALQVIQQALNAATQKGVYTLSDVSAILQALNKVNELVEIIPSSDEQKVK
jgi:hypothetical protein